MNRRIPATLVAVAACTSQAADTNKAQHMVVSRSETRAAAKGPAANFTGEVSVTPLFSATDGRHASGGLVTFQPGSRSAWHTHPAGQTLIVTSGTGWVQEWDGTKIEVKAGDVIWTPPGVKHWHGGTSSSALTHIALQESVNGSVVDWKERVTDEQYGK